SDCGGRVGSGNSAKVTAMACAISLAPGWLRDIRCGVSVISPACLLRPLRRHVTMEKDLGFSVSRISFDENYVPSDNTRITTNFANLARGENRRDNLRNTLA